MNLPEIKGFIDLSLVDWDGKVTSVAFLPHCNFRCPFCYNCTLVLEPEGMPTVPYEEVEQYLLKNKGWLDGVAITGGEPTLHDNLPNLCQRFKGLELGVKVDTNGTNAAMVRRLVAQKLVDYVALDIKAPLTVENYSEVVGVNAEKLLAEVKTTVKILMKSSVDYEFRTTLVPSLHGKDDIELICGKIEGCKKYVLQNFKGDAQTLDPRLKGVEPFSPEEMAEFLKIAKKAVPNTFLR
jgi:pyruvate formate lyase activating enzyme